VPPPSQKLVDTACLGFAAWTLVTHAVVALEGSLHDLLVAAAALAALGLAAASHGRRRRARLAMASPGAGAERAPPAAVGRVARSPGAERPAADPARSLRGAGLRGWLRAALVVAGAAALFAWRGDAVALWWVGVLVLSAAAALFVLGTPPRVEPAVGGRAREAVLLALAVSGAALALVAHRDDHDDAFYVNVAAAISDAPEAVLLRDDTLHGVPGLPIQHPAYRLHGFEVLAGAVAFATGIPAIAVFHLGLAALGAFLLPLAQARLFRLLTPRTWLWTVAALLLVLVATGDAHRWYGNFAFVRMWQGKAFLLGVFLPLVQAHALEFGLSPSWRGWLRLFAAQVAALGASSTALWAAPAAAGIALACAVVPGWRGLRILAVGVLASVYLVAAGLALRHAMESESHARGARWTAELAEQAERSAREAHAPGVQLAESFTLVLGKGRLRTAAVVACVLAWAVTGPGLAVRFAILAPLLSGLLLEPHASRWLAEHAIGPYTWRALWVVPVPALLALVVTAPLRLEGRGRRVGRATCLALAAAFALVVPERSSLARDNGVRLGWPGLKVPREDYHLAELLSRSVPPGSHVIAPLRVSRWIPVLPQRAYPLVVRPHYLQGYRTQLGDEDIELRVVASLVAGGEQPRADAYPLFAQALELYAVKGVLLDGSPGVERVRRILSRAGFQRVHQEGGSEVWVRWAPP
jgi:hypothetical protein